MSIDRRYDPAEDRVLIEVSLDGDDLEERRAALARVLRTAAFPSRMLRRPQASLDDLERAFTSSYEFSFRRPEGALEREREFFEACARHPELDELTLRYVDFVSGRHQSLGLKHLRHDEAHPAGCYALAPLVLRSVEHLPALGQYLLESDLDDETVQSGLVRSALAAHGICEETLELLALRIATSHGQFSQEDLRFALAELDLLAHLEARPDVRSRFLALVVRRGRLAGLDPSLTLGTLAYVLGRGDHRAWERWARLVREAHEQELALIEPGPRYQEESARGAPEPPRRWDEE